MILNLMLIDYDDCVRCEDDNTLVSTKCFDLILLIFIHDILLSPLSNVFLLSSLYAKINIDTKQY